MPEAAAPPLTLVTCAESGPREVEVVRLVSSLRQWGGRLANAPVLAISPRTDTKLTPETQRAFGELGIRYAQTRPRPRFAWYPFMNKVACVEYAQRVVSTELIGWLDTALDRRRIRARREALRVMLRLSRKVRRTWRERVRCRDY